jgi:hypothetical protein
VKGNRWAVSELARSIYLQFKSLSKLFQGRGNNGTLTSAYSLNYKSTEEIFISASPNFHRSIGTNEADFLSRLFGKRLTTSSSVILESKLAQQYLFKHEGFNINRVTNFQKEDFDKVFLSVCLKL